jgi:hypothetical protein
MGSLRQQQGDSDEEHASAAESDGACLSRIGAGITSMRQLPELHAHAASLTTLCLHGNAITRIEGLHEAHTPFARPALTQNTPPQCEALLWLWC